MRVLMIGSGGREHAILWTLKRTSGVSLDLYCAPGNAGIAQLAKCVPAAVSDHAALVHLAQSLKIDLTIVGPEGPLAAGLVDEFERNGLKIMGPSLAASRLEASKTFAKDFMKRHNIPTADYAVAVSAAEAIHVLRSGRFGPPESSVVIKADGLAAGKGVVVAGSRAEGEQAVADLSSGGLVSEEAAKQILIEETLEGREVSVLLFSDGTNYALMPPARDHKRIGENDTGPNTGGMGAITDDSVVDRETINQIVSEVVEPTLKGAREEGFPFRGILFVGLMLTASGPKVLEYNVRFGDPETQAILVRLESDLLDIFQSIAEGRLRNTAVKWSDHPSACVVLASKGYPGEFKNGVLIEGLDQIAPSEIEPRVQVFHAGTALSGDGAFLTAGGRVLGVTATGETLGNALERCYAAVEGIRWDGMQFRRDIGQFNEIL
ncbi:MAG TPA: phosphoribosylamine--glycine ligase [Pyrinomonadaceae bacterium]|nr:phosphoribosylamine--glycine ligase [Pyrinomonadaceae bacterium]